MITHGAVWEDKNSWSASWEEKYKSWVKQNWDKKYFAKNTIYKGLLGDHLPENSRKREFLKSLYGVVSTKRLPKQRVQTNAGR